MRSIICSHIKYMRPTICLSKNVYLYDDFFIFMMPLYIPAASAVRLIARRRSCDMGIPGRLIGFRDAHPAREMTVFDAYYSATKFSICQ